MLKIGITDDHALFRKSLSLLIESFTGMHIIIEAKNGLDLLEQLKIKSIDILLLDLQMPKMDGFQTCLKINELYPKIKILILTLKNDPVTIQKAIHLNVQGFFSKNTDPIELKNAILKLNSNGFYFEKELSSVIEKSLATSITPEHKTALLLTDREMQVLHLTLQELNGKETAERMHISPRTVEKHKKNLMIKTKSKNFIGVIIYALNHKFLNLEDLPN